MAKESPIKRRLPTHFPFIPLMEIPLRCSLWASSSTNPWPSLPTVVVARKSKTAWLHRSSGKRSRILNRSLPLSLCLSPHFRPQDFLLAFPVRAALEEMLPRLGGGLGYEKHPVCLHISPVPCPEHIEMNN